MKSNMLTGIGLAQYAISLLGAPYVYGVNGDVISEALIQRKAIQYPNYYTASYIAKARKFIGQRAYDCSSITDLYTETDRSANGWLAACAEKGPISTIPEIIGLIVHKDGHMGVYIGQGYAVEARGIDYGVVKTRVSDRPWTSWGKLPGIEYAAPGEPIGEDTDMLKLGDIGQAVYDYQLGLKTFGYDFGDAGDMHDDVVRNGLTGIFDARLVDVTTSFQASHGLAQTGQADMATYGRLMAEIVNMTGHGTVQQADYEAALRNADELSDKLTAQIGITADTSAELAKVQALYDQETQTSAHWASEASGNQGKLDELSALERRKKEILGL